MAYQPFSFWVYPRRCGGTRLLFWATPKIQGLSPQVRGNLSPHIDKTRDMGSIPAGAGEPLWASRCTPRPGVYPRRCGGTLAIGRRISENAGLSPQVRGNHLARRGSTFTERSIPAGAGEPAFDSPTRRVLRVYPRRCGGTFGTALAEKLARGLSPQVRGNLLHSLTLLGKRGSIPAGAGEPSGYNDEWDDLGVYPRRCGGTAFQCGRNVQVLGLSPQVRGNLDQVRVIDRLPGSIPAGAGEPA